MNKNTTKTTTKTTTPDITWLNENSRKFLSRGYLSEGVTPEQRIRFIAENAEKILKKKGFADKFYGYMARGFYSLSTPVWANFGLDKEKKGPSTTPAPKFAGRGPKRDNKK